MDVYVVLINADFTEGRGPMKFHKVFDTLDTARTYVMSQKGIFGSDQKEHHYSWTGKDKWSFNGYEIHLAPLLTSQDASLINERRQQIEKLKEQQITIEKQIKDLEKKV